MYAFEQAANACLCGYSIDVVLVATGRIVPD